MIPQYEFFDDGLWVDYSEDIAELEAVLKRGDDAEIFAYVDGFFPEYGSSAILTREWAISSSAILVWKYEPYYIYRYQTGYSVIRRWDEDELLDYVRRYGMEDVFHLRYGSEITQVKATTITDLVALIFDKLSDAKAEIELLTEQVKREKNRYESLWQAIGLDELDD